MSNVLDAVSRYRKIEDVTSPKDDAAPVYLMDELAELSMSSHEQAESIAEHVSKRLANKSPVVKWKALRLVRHLCNRGGCTTFQRCMQRYSASVRELVHFQGDKDPFKGDSLNQRVRETAKEVIEVLYSSAPAPVATSGTTAPKGRIQGFGCSSAAQPHTSNIDSFSSRPQPQSGSSKMVGFGSDGRSHNMQPAPSPSADLTSSVTSAVNNLGGLIRSQFPSGNREHTSALHQRTGSYGDSTYVDFGLADSSSVASSSGRRIGQGASLSPGNLRGQPINVSAVMGSEEQLVGDICAPVGLRPAPDPEDLRKFVESASNMDGLRIGELLIGKMTSPSWQVVLRSLHALEAVLQHGSSQACGEVAVMFQSDPSPVTRALSSVQGSVKERAACCLRLLLNEEAPDMPASAATAHGHQPATKLHASALLMDFGSAGGSRQDRTPAAGAPPTVSVTAPEAPMDLLGELDSAPAASSTAPSSQQPQPLAPQPHDPFSTMDMSALHISVPSIAPAQVMPPVRPPAPSPHIHAGAGATAAISGAATRPSGPLDDFFSSSVPCAGAMPHQQPGQSSGLGALPPGVPFGYSNMQHGSGGLQGMSDSGVPVGGSHGVGHGGSHLQQQQQLGYNPSMRPDGNMGMPGAMASASSSTSFGGMMPAPAAGPTANGSGAAAKWMMPPQGQPAGVAATSWMTPAPQPSASQQPCPFATASKASDSAFDFVKDILK